MLLGASNGLPALDHPPVVHQLQLPDRIAIGVGGSGALELEAGWPRPTGADPSQVHQGSKEKSLHGSGLIGFDAAQGIKGFLD